jgi:hypothetical protein
MISRALILAAAALSLASCGREKPIECDYDGMIIIPADASEREKTDYRRRNMELIAARLDAATGMLQVYDKTRLAKARGCP